MLNNYKITQQRDFVIMPDVSDHIISTQYGKISFGIWCRLEVDRINYENPAREADIFKNGRLVGVKANKYKPIMTIYKK